MDPDATWYVGRPRPRPHYARWGPSSFPPKGEGAQPTSAPALQFLAHVYCGKTAGWIKIPLRIEVGLGPGHIVLDGAQLPPKRGA